jgi:hypothetical protein
MRTLSIAGCLVALVACDGAYKDSGIVDSGPLGCCTYTCSDGETEGSFVSASDGDCQSAASTSCSSADAEVDTVDFLEDQECAR